MPEIKLHTGPEYRFAQSRHEEMMTLPARCLIYAPSGSGKTVTLSSLFCDLLRTKSGKSCFSRIFMWSPTIHLDGTWLAVKRFQRTVMEVPEQEERELYHEEFSEGQLERVIRQQHAIAQLAKDKGHRSIPQVACVLDDVADDSSITRSSKALVSLFLRGRHAGISTFLSTQVFKVSPAIRRNASCAIYFAPQNLSDRQAIVEETSAMVGGKKVMEKIFDVATRRRHSVLFIRFDAKRPRDRFWERSTHRLAVDDKRADSESG